MLKNLPDSTLGYPLCVYLDSIGVSYVRQNNSKNPLIDISGRGASYDEGHLVDAWLNGAKLRDQSPDWRVQYLAKMSAEAKSLALAPFIAACVLQRPVTEAHERCVLEQIAKLFTPEGASNVQAFEDAIRAEFTPPSHWVDGTRRQAEREGKDFVQLAAAMHLGIPYEAVTPKKREQVQALLFAFTYGENKQGLLMESAQAKKEPSAPRTGGISEVPDHRCVPPGIGGKAPAPVRK